MVLQYVLGRMNSPAAQAERFKMLAGGVQLVAIGVWAAAIIAPLFNAVLTPGPFAKMGGGVTAALIELLAWHLMGYAVAVPAPGQEDDHG